MTANADGTWNSSIQYTAFGEIRASSGLTATKYRYTGQLAQDVLGLDYYVARFYDPYLNRWIQPDSIIPDPLVSADFDRYSYTRNNPLRYTDNSGHCVDGITTVACLIIIGVVVLKVVDYGWTAYDVYQSGQVMSDPNATQKEKDIAAADIAMAVGFEAAEPDDLLPIALPIDDLLRKGIIKGAKEISEEAGEKAFRKFTASNFRENLRRLTGKATEDIVGKEAHHVLPHEFIEDFSKQEININDPKFGTWVDKGVHQGWSRAYNDKWRRFLRENPTKKEILKFARKLGKEYGFDVEF